MKKQPGYPLPSGDVSESELECAVVFYPKRAEYRQALLGSLTYLATWRAWERDEDKRGKDAADSWRIALEATMGCWNMTCIEDLIANQEWMIEWMATHSLDCCEGTTYGDTTIITTIIIPFIGDAPDYYGETALTDWDDWAEHLCYNANLWVDLLIENALVLEAGGLAGGIGMGMLAYALAAIAFISTGGLLAIPVIMLGASALAAAYASDIFSDAADDLETARDDIVCALMWGQDVGDAIETALSSGLAWDLFFSLLDYDTPTAILYEGGGQDGYLPAGTSDACYCEEPQELNGWTETLAQVTGLNLHESEPFCASRWSRSWNDYLSPGGALEQGTITIRGTLKLTGTYHEHANCAGTGQVRILVGAMWDSSSPDHSDPQLYQEYIEIGTVPGVMDYEIGFERSWNVWNTKWFTLASQATIWHGGTNFEISCRVIELSTAPD